MPNIVFRLQTIVYALMLLSRLRCIFLNLSLGWKTETTNILGCYSLSCLVSASHLMSLLQENGIGFSLLIGKIATLTLLWLVGDRLCAFWGLLGCFYFFSIATKETTPSRVWGGSGIGNVYVGKTEIMEDETNTHIDLGNQGMCVKKRDGGNRSQSRRYKIRDIFFFEN